MVSKIVNSLNSINKFSTGIIKVGSFVSLALCLAGIAIVCYNNAILMQINMYDIGTAMISSSILLFAEIVIGSIIIDFFGRMTNGDN